MTKEDIIKATGKVTVFSSNDTFRVTLPSGHIVVSKISGKMRKNFIRISVGDTVDIEMSAYDLTRGRIVYKHKLEPIEKKNH